MATAKKLVVTAAVCAVLLSATTIVRVEAEVDAAGTVVTSLRGGRRALISTDRNSQYSKHINFRRLGDENSEEEEAEEEEEKEEEEEEEEEKEEQQENEYQEGEGNDDGGNEEEEQEEEAEEQSEEEAENDDGNAGDDATDDDQAAIVASVQETVDTVKTNFESLMDRFDEDVILMWSTSPSEWDDECWKVFAITAGIFTLLLSCIFYLFCLCCGCGSERDRDNLIVGSKSNSGWKKNNHRGRIFGRHGSKDDDDTAGFDTVASDSERPFVLIEDVENDDEKSKSSHAINELTSPVYARGRSGVSHGVSNGGSLLSPESQKTQTNDFSTRNLPASPSRHAATANEALAAQQLSFDGTRTFDTATSRKERKVAPNGGLISETVEVWSEFLGFKKSKYNMKPVGVVASHDEDEDINLTDDEGRNKFVRAPSAASKTRRSGPSQMKTGTYSRPEIELASSHADPIVSAAASTSSAPINNSANNSANNSTTGSTNSPTNEKVGVQTPVMSNARVTKTNSPRRTALLKTKNLLRTFKSNGNSKTKNKSNRINNSNSNTDPKEESLLNNDTLESNNVV